MRVADFIVIAVVTYVFSHWVRVRVTTMRAAYWCGVGVMFIFYLGLADYCAH